MKLSANQQVNRLGKYIHKHFDRSTRLRINSSNTCDVFFTLVYQLKHNLQKVGYWEDVNEIRMDISITTYQNKVRVNIIELDEYEKTLGFLLFMPEQLEDLEAAKVKIWNKIIKCIEKEYKDYEFLY